MKGGHGTRKMPRVASEVAVAACLGDMAGQVDGVRQIGWCLQAFNDLPFSSKMRRQDATRRQAD